MRASCELAERKELPEIPHIRPANQYLSCVKLKFIIQGLWNRGDFKLDPGRPHSGYGSKQQQHFYFLKNYKKRKEMSKIFLANKKISKKIP
jgi:hypothetical protein